MPFVNRDGVRLYRRADGEADKPALLILNSIGCDMSLWDGLVPHLTARFRVLRMDARGHGASDAPVGDYSLDELAADALAVLDAASAPCAAVCGLSLGGMVAMTLALAAPSRVEALVLVCTSALMDPAAWQARIDTVREQGLAAIADLAMERFFSERFRRQAPGVVATTRAGLLAMSPDGYAGCCAAIRDMNLADRLPDIAARTLVIAGERDVSTPFEDHARRIVAAIPDARAGTLDTGHLPSLEAPAGLAGLVLDFLAAADPAVEGARAAVFDAGLAVRREVLGDAWVDRALAGRTPFNADFQAMITRYAWNEVWGRPGLDHRMRRLLVVAMTASLGRWEEFRLHVRSGLEQGGFTSDELKEVLLQTAIYAGVPVANTAFAEAAAIIESLP
jgi:3-oxoadipate enol-lactonase / 4-carboxymuconolactone decarboxylase